MSHDNTGRDCSTGREHWIQSLPVAMKNTHHAKMTELLSAGTFRGLANEGAERDARPFSLRADARGRRR